MATVQHTPGPWQVERRWNNDWEIVPRITCKPDSDRGCGRIADLVGAPYIGHESTLPNAYLIAAAPDLLAACKAIQYAAKTSNTEEKFGEAVSDVLDMLNAAVAKANGPKTE